MPDDDHDDGDEHSDEARVDEDGEGAPSSERTPTDIGPDASTSGGLPGDGSDEDDAASAPLSDLREDVERRREENADDDFEELFTEMDVDGADEEVWDALSETGPSTAGTAVDASTTAAGTPADASADADTVHETREVTVVEKRLCHGCPHFSDPPETRCTHDGTTIEAEVDIDHFRVVDCPIVAEREYVETSGFSADES